MKYTIIFAALASAISAAITCPAGYFGEGCLFACSDGCANNDCDANTGICKDTNCLAGWTNTNSNEAKCDSPICEGGEVANKCDNGGQCVAPNVCICGQSGAQIVAKDVSEDSDKPIYQCVSLRKDGIKGAFIALVIMIVSVSTCGFIAEKKGAPK